MNNTKILWNEPTPVGAAILDPSKLTLYGFHYKEMKPRYGYSITVVYKDTDSLLYRVETNNLYSDMGNLKHLFDLSDYLTSHPLFDASNKKVPLTRTDELQGKVLEEVVCNIRYLLGDGIQSVAYGHVQLNQFGGMFLLLFKRLSLCCFLVTI